MDHYRDVANPERFNHYFFFYGNYYATQAMFITGGSDWTVFYTRLRDDLLELQRRNGDNGSVRSNVGTAFSTAVTALLLEVPNNYLPIFQR
jgi:hypothetical protein